MWRLNFGKSVHQVGSCITCGKTVSNKTLRLNFGSIISILHRHYLGAVSVLSLYSISTSDSSTFAHSNSIPVVRFYSYWLIISVRESGRRSTTVRRAKYSYWLMQSNQGSEQFNSIQFGVEIELN
jgi:hypothetical protein